MHVKFVRNNNFMETIENGLSQQIEFQFNTCGGFISLIEFVYAFRYVSGEIIAWSSVIMLFGFLLLFDG